MKGVSNAKFVNFIGSDPNSANLSKSRSGILPLESGWKPLLPLFPSLKLVPFGSDPFILPRHLAKGDYGKS